MVSGAVIFFSGCIYLRAGVVRDVPELEINKSNVHRNMHAEYCDRVYKYDCDFVNDNKIKVLVIGNSFARDFANILLESEYSDDIDLSYSYTVDNNLLYRVKNADRIFIFLNKDDIPIYFWENIRDVNIVYGIGTKWFGATNGQVYFNRFKSDYYNYCIELDSGYRKLNTKWEEAWGSNYINLIEAVEQSDGSIRVFTDDNKYISQDCEHLTRSGAEYYAQLIDLRRILFSSDEEKR